MEYVREEELNGAVNGGRMFVPGRKCSVSSEEASLIVRGRRVVR